MSHTFEKNCDKGVASIMEAALLFYLDVPVLSQFAPYIVGVDNWDKVVDIMYTLDLPLIPGSTDLLPVP